MYLRKKKESKFAEQESSQKMYKLILQMFSLKHFWRGAVVTVFYRERVHTFIPAKKGF